MFSGPEAATNLPQALVAAACMLLSMPAAAADEIAQAEYRWTQSPQDRKSVV